MSPNGLRQFLEKEQSMKDVKAEFAVGLIRRFDPSPSKEMGRMILAGKLFHQQFYYLLVFIFF